MDFEPAFVGQPNVYLSAVDDLLKHPDDLPTIGLLLARRRTGCSSSTPLRGIDKPMGVAAWETQLVEVLPKDLEGSPTVAQIEAELARPATDLGRLGSRRYGSGSAGADDCSQASWTPPTRLAAAAARFGRPSPEPDGDPEACQQRQTKQGKGRWPSCSVSTPVEYDLA